ncbi:MAG: molybdopterin molybdotransferase MoeA [Eubacteriales bacterium]
MAISLEDARSTIRKHITPMTETIELNVEMVNGYVLAEDVYARFNQPPFNRSPLDGYAFIAEDSTGANEDAPVKLSVVEEVFAGQYPSKGVMRGQATRIMTGAPIPEGANCVIRQEDTNYGERDVEIYKTLEPFQNYCYEGEDVKAGELILGKETKLNFLHIGMLCAQGIERVNVYRRPKVLLITTGDEVVSYNQELSPGKIYNFSHYALKQRIADTHAEVDALHMTDNGHGVASYIAEHADVYDLLVTTGGVSVGKKDILHEVYEELEVEKIFWRVAVKPGSPAMFTVYKDIPIISLSGNPFATLVTYDLLVRDVLAMFLHDPSVAIQYQDAILEDDFKKHSPGRRFVRAYYEAGKVYFPTDVHMSGAIMSTANCNCFLDIPAGNRGLVKGTKVRIFKYVN